MNRSWYKIDKNEGYTLLEVIIALLLVGITVTSVSFLFTFSLNLISEAQDRTRAVYLAAGTAEGLNCSNGSGEFSVNDEFAVHGKLSLEIDCQPVPGLETARAVEIIVFRDGQDGKQEELYTLKTMIFDPD